MKISTTRDLYTNQTEKEDKSVGLDSEVININEENYQRGIENWFQSPDR